MELNEQQIVNELELTEIQTEAAIWDKGPLLLLAGPGAGKTRVLTARIALLLNNSREDNFRILALTFTNKAAAEMRERIQLLVPGMEQRLFIGTFHSFCAEVLRNQGSSVGVNPDFTIYSNEDDLQEILSDVMRDLIRSGEVEEIGLSNLLPVIQFLQSNLLSPGESSANLIRTEGLRETVEKVYSTYFERMQQLNALDFNMLIIKSYELLSQFPFVAKHYQRIYPYMCIDEFQDTNSAQYQLITSLTGTNYKNIFSVADDDQIIYQWNGASFKRIEDFKRDYNADVLQLPDNFRCPSTVVNLANNLIKFNSNRTADKRPLVAHRFSADNSVRLFKFSTFEEEVDWISDDVITTNSAFPEQSIAVIARNRRILQSCLDSMTGKGVHAVLYRRKNEFESPYFIWLHNVLRLTRKRNDRRFLSRLLEASSHFMDNVPEADEIKMWSEATDGDLLRGYVETLGEGQLPEQILSSLKLALAERQDYKSFVTVSLKWFGSILEEENNSEANSESNSLEGEISAWNSISKEIFRHHDEDSLTLSTFLQELDLASKETESAEGQIQCLTIHASKGKEFDHVYLAGMVEDELPSFQSIKKGDNSIQMEEERRNCYVAITRTKSRLTLTYSDVYRGWNKSPSRFLKEMGLIP